MSVLKAIEACGKCWYRYDVWNLPREACIDAVRNVWFSVNIQENSLGNKFAIQAEIRGAGDSNTLDN